MKKITFLITALAVLILSGTKIQAQNIYAYDLKVLSPGGIVNPVTKQVQVSYKLNAAASEVSFLVPGCTIADAGAPGLTAGVAHTVTLTLDNLPPAGGEFVWSVKAVGTSTYSNPTLVSPLTAPYQIYSPRNVAVDNNFDSPFFGNVYLVNGNTGYSNGALARTQQGIYMYDPLLQIQNPTDTQTTPITYNSYSGNVAWNPGATIWETPFGVAVAPDGKVYVTNGAVSPLGGIYRMDPKNPEKDFVSVFENAPGVTPFCQVTGTGENTKIYVMNIGAVAVNSTTAYIQSLLQVYNIPEIPTSNAANLIFDPGNLITNRVNAIVPGKDGGWWITQASRTDATSIVGSQTRTSPSLIYIKADGTVMYNSANDATIHALFNTMGTGSGGSMAVSADGNYLAVTPFRNSQTIRILKITYTGDTPSLEFQYNVVTGGGGTSNVTSVLADYSGLAFDRGFNLYTTDAGGEWMRVFALPKAENAAVTPAPADQVIIIEEAVTPAEPQANIYASELKASKVSTDGEIEFSYTLNADAVSVTIEVSNGEVFEITTPADLTKGAHTVTKTLTIESAVGDYAWTVTVVGEPNTADAPVKVSDDAEHLGFRALRGLAVDNSFESPFFGRVYATEGNETTAGEGIRTTNDGVYIYNAALEDVTGQGNAAYSGGIVWGLSGAANSGASPFRVATAEDGTVYITDWSDTHSGIWTMDPANPTADLQPVFGGARDSRGVLIENGVEIVGSISHCYIEGTGADTKLYTFDEDLGLTSGVSGNIYRYDIGNAENPWIAAPSALIYNDGSYGNLQQNGNSCISPDGRGGWWISQYRSNDTDPAIPSLIHFTGTSVDFISAVDIAGLVVNSGQGGMALNEDKSLIALTGNGVVRIFDINFDGTGKPVLTLKYTIATSFANNSYSVALDKADNIYVGGNASAFAIFALPKADNSFTTPAPASQPVTITTGDGINLTIAGDIFAFCENNQITVTSDKAIQAVKLYDLQGRTIDSKQGLANKCTLTAPGKGIYIVEAVTEGVCKVQKVAVR